MPRPASPNGDASDNPVPGEPAASDAPVRRGSPFAKSPQQSASDALPISGMEPAFDPEWGVLRAANWASAWVAICGLACLQMFPGGGVIVAALGCALATIGLFSSRALLAGGLLALHAWLFFACYQKLF